MPKVSVVVPTYNSAQYISETINSIIAQTYHDIEIIIVDDCSTDDTERVVKSFSSDKIRYIRLTKNHGGPSKPRNVGIKAAKGKYIAFCDSDDMIMPDRIESSVKLFDKHPELGMTFSDEQKFSEVTGEDLGNFLREYDLFHSLPKEKASENCFIIASKDAFPCLFYENYIMPSGVTVRSSIFQKVGYFDETITNGDDWDMWFRISQKFPVGFVDKIGFRYRVRTNSISGRGPELAENRSQVIRKQLETGISIKLQKRCHELIGMNNYGIGYYFQMRGEMEEARKYYLQSLHEYFNWSALKGIFISMLGKKIYLDLKEMKPKQGE